MTTKHPPQVVADMATLREGVAAFEFWLMLTPAPGKRRCKRYIEAERRVLDYMEGKK